MGLYIVLIGCVYFEWVGLNGECFVIYCVKVGMSFVEVLIFLECYYCDVFVIEVGDFMRIDKIVVLRVFEDVEFVCVYGYYVVRQIQVQWQFFEIVGI